MPRRQWDPVRAMATYQRRQEVLMRRTEVLQEGMRAELRKRGGNLPDDSDDSEDIVPSFTSPTTLQELVWAVNRFHRSDVAWRLTMLELRVVLKRGGHTLVDPLMAHEYEADAGLPLARRVEHEITHGGNVVDDLHAIHYAELTGMEAVTEFKVEFEKMYGVSTECAADMVEESPVELIVTFNALATIQTYPRWQHSSMQADKKSIEEVARHIIRVCAEMKDSRRRRRLFGPGGHLDELYDSMQMMYMQNITGMRG
ncbi:hypothetical protein FQN57_003121 [Myotisia sp. PD_48]|nr:hypothetical protein FQN57_003121 [Myotisia sp. PD_48]